MMEHPRAGAPLGFLGVFANIIKSGSTAEVNMDGDPSNQQNQQPNPAYDAWSSMANEVLGENYNPAAPEGVRDEQDYREYQAEREAKKPFSTKTFVAEIS